MSEYVIKRESTTPYGIIGIRFIDKDNLSAKIYDYYVDYHMYQYFYRKVHGQNQGIVSTFNITNDKGYNYRESEVVVVQMKLCHSEMEARGLSAIGSAREWGVYYSDSLKYEVKCEYPGYENPDKEDKEDKEDKNKVTNFTTEKGNKNMFKNVMKDVRFGRIEDGSVKMSIYGPAFLTADNGYCAYDKKTDNYVDVTDMLLDIDNLCYMVPMAKSEVRKGDFIFHNSTWVRVIDFNEKKYPVVENIYKKEVLTILPTKNIFGFDFYTKLVSCADSMFNATSDNPFGAMLPLMMLNEGATDKNSLLPMMMLMNGGQFNGTFDMSNPMVMFMMLNGDSNDSSLKDLMMINLLSTMANSNKIETEKEQEV